jgi:SAM-dependent methyltransferase
LPKDSSDFDSLIDRYDEQLVRGISVSGESREYFFRRRIEWLQRCLEQAGVSVRRILDFGCGTGAATPAWLDAFGPEGFVGVDESERSLERARATFGSEYVRFLNAAECPPEPRFDVVYANGVFHHVPPGERGAVVAWVRERLRRGGVFAFWENNPWSPAARYVMSRIPFDRNAVMVWPHQARRLVREAGFEVRRTDYLFFLPRALRVLRFAEPHFRWLPFGAQYQVLAERL